MPKIRGAYDKFHPMTGYDDYTRSYESIMTDTPDFTQYGLGASSKNKAMGCGTDCGCKSCSDSLGEIKEFSRTRAMGDFDLSSIFAPVSDSIQKVIENPISILTGSGGQQSTPKPTTYTQSPTGVYGPMPLPKPPVSGFRAELAKFGLKPIHLVLGGAAILALIVLLPSGSKSGSQVIVVREPASPPAK